MHSVFISMSATSIGAVFHLIPDQFPFLSPTERPMAGQTNFGREVSFFEHINIDLILQGTVSLRSVQNLTCMT
jgi:hypothetical protein